MSPTLSFSPKNPYLMPAERYFLDHSFQEHDIYELKGTEFHHLAHVMRTRPGERVELVNGKGGLAVATVQEILKEKARLKLEQTIQEPIQPCRLILAQALPKPQRLDFILEKGTELGADAFWLFPGHLSVKKELLSHQLGRARMQTIAAMKQCGRLTLPSLIVQPSLEKWPCWTGMTVFFGDLAPDAPPLETAWREKKNPSFPVLFITGPEAGFSKQELDYLKKQGAIGVKLHRHILRTDTASLASLSLLSHWLLL